MAKLLDQYKEITTKIIDELRADRDINTLMEEREKILKEIESLNISKDELLEEYTKLDIKAIDDNLGELIKLKMNEVKDRIKEGKVRRSAFSSYSSVNRQGNLFARKV